MKRLTLFFLAIFSTIVFGATCAEKTPVAWPCPDHAAIQQELTHWLGPEIQALEPNQSGEPLRKNVVKIMREHSRPVAEYVDACEALVWQDRPFGQPFTLPKIPLHVLVEPVLETDAKTGTGACDSAYLRAALIHLLAERLVQARFYDEALPLLETMTPENSVDPAGVLLLRAIVYQHLSCPEKGLEAIQAFWKTVENDASTARRRTELAKLLEFEFQQQCEEQKNAEQRNSAPSAQHIGRKMNDVRRRLGQGRTDEGTQEAENDVLKSLDQLIEEIEAQAKKQGETSASDQGQQGNQPAEDSRVLKQKGPGNVDRRDFDMDSDWGALPPKEREAALLKMEKEFPPHYRDIIEQYFREMATEPPRNEN